MGIQWEQMEQSRRFGASVTVPKLHLQATALAEQVVWGLKARLYEPYESVVCMDFDCLWQRPCIEWLYRPTLSAQSHFRSSVPTVCAYTILSTTQL